MSTVIRVSISGDHLSALRKSVADFLSSKGMKRRGKVEFFDDRGLSPRETALIINGVYDQEAKHDKTRVTTLKITSRLVNVEMKRDEYRSI